MKKLSEYLKETGQTYRQFASKVPMSPSFLSELLSEGRKSPSVDLALKIQKATGGAVEITDWPKLAELGRVFQKSSPSSPPSTGA